MISDSCVLRDQIVNSPRGRWELRLCATSGKEGRRRNTRAAPHTYHRKVTVPHPHSSCQLSRLRSNHVRLHRTRTPRRPSLPLNPSGTPSCSCRGTLSTLFKQRRHQSTFYTSPPPSYSSFLLSPSQRVQDPRRRPRASSNREKARSGMAVRFLGWRLVTSSS